MNRYMQPRIPLRGNVPIFIYENNASPLPDRVSSWPRYVVPAMPPKNYYGELFAGINGKRIWNSRWKNSFGECFFPVVERPRTAWSNQRVAELDSVDLFKRKFLLVERLLRCHVSAFTGIRNMERKFNKWFVVRTAVDERRFKAWAIQKRQNVWKKKEIVDKCNIDDFLSTWRKMFVST